MHLDHKIPWNTAASHFKYVRSNPHFTPHNTDLFSRGLPSQANDLNHFRRVLIASIREFSLTQEKKTPDVPSIADSEPLFSDSLLHYPEQKYGLESHAPNSALHNPLSHEHRRIAYWVKRAAHQDGDGSSYSSGDGDFADAVKMLIIVSADGDQAAASEAQRALHRLSQHPNIPLQDLWNIHWGHSFGFNHVADRALEAYLIINIFAAVFEKHSPSFEDHKPLLEASSVGRFIRDATANYDFPTQNIPHRVFWREIGISDDRPWGQDPASSEGEHPTVVDPLQPSSTDEVRSKLKQYLKTCFAILYHYDMLMRKSLSDEEVDQMWSYDIVSFMQFWGCRTNPDLTYFVQ